MDDLSARVGIGTLIQSCLTGPCVAFAIPEYCRRAQSGISGNTIYPLKGGVVFSYSPKAAFLASIGTSCDSKISPLPFSTLRASI